MTQEQRSLKQDDADRLTAKLQEFYSSLSGPERQVMELVLRQASAEGQIEGYQVGSILTVGPILGAAPSSTRAPNSEQLTIRLVFP